MKKTYLFTILLAWVFISLIKPCTSYGQSNLFFADIKLEKDTLYPFDIIEFTIYFKALKTVKALRFSKSSYVQIRMEEPRQTRWYTVVDDFGGFVDDESRTPQLIPPDYLVNYTFTKETISAFNRRDTICFAAIRPGRYTLRVVYSPEKILIIEPNLTAAIENCTNCIIKEATLVVLDHYPKKDQAAFEWVIKQKYKCVLFRTYYGYEGMDEIIAEGEEFLSLFPESSFAPLVHCKVGENLRKNFEKNSEEWKLPPVEAYQKLVNIVHHLSYCKQLKGYIRLTNYYYDMYDDYKDLLFRFKVRQGIK